MNMRRRMIQQSKICTCLSDADDAKRTRPSTLLGQTTTSSENAAQSSIANDNGSYESLAIGLGVIGALLVLIVIAIVALFVRTQRAGGRDGANVVSMSSSSSGSTSSSKKRTSEYGAAPPVEQMLTDRNL